MKEKVVIGCGAGYSGDRIEPAEELVSSGKLDYIVFECLAERTIALAQLKKLKDSKTGYDPLLIERMERILPLSHENKVKLLTNMGAANPLAAMEKTLEIAKNYRLKGTRVAAVTGDDVSEIISQINPIIQETGKSLEESLSSFVSANAYLGAEYILPALERAADVVITGRVADPTLFLSPIVYEFGWSLYDWTALAKGTIIGHLLECAGQLTGGYYAEPGKKDVRDLARLGFPIAEVFSCGDAVFTKLKSAGGKIDLSTCKEQMLYEIHDPGAYLTPDVTADFTQVKLTQVGPDRVSLTGGRGRSRPDQLKVNIAYQDGYIGEGTISYAGTGALNRARLAADVVKERLKIIGANYREIRFDLLGINALYREAAVSQHPPYEVTLKVAAKTDTIKQAQIIGNEVETLYTNGPAGGGGAKKSVSETVAIVSAFIPRDIVKSTITLKKVD